MRLRTAILQLCAVVAMAAIAPMALGQTTKPAGAAIVIKNFDFSPMTVTVPVGGQVTWTNKDGEIHTVVGLDGSFRSGGLDQDDSFTFRFTKPGTYAYVCSVHPRMKGQIIVR
ncbi:MAG TPA: cupredoxin family copper-binding protein [Caulobacteraceae bacterium]|jgi:plastocyanin